MSQHPAIPSFLGAFDEGNFLAMGRLWDTLIPPDVKDDELTLKLYFYLNLWLTLSPIHPRTLAGRGSPQTSSRFSDCAANFQRFLMQYSDRLTSMTNLKPFFVLPRLTPAEVYVHPSFSELLRGDLWVTRLREQLQSFLTHVLPAPPSPPRAPRFVSSQYGAPRQPAFESSGASAGHAATVPLPLAEPLLTFSRLLPTDARAQLPPAAPHPDLPDGILTRHPPSLLQSTGGQESEWSLSDQGGSQQPELLQDQLAETLRTIAATQGRERALRQEYKVQLDQAQVTSARPLASRFPRFVCAAGRHLASAPASHTFGSPFAPGVGRVHGGRWAQARFRHLLQLCASMMATMENMRTRRETISGGYIRSLYEHLCEFEQTLGITPSVMGSLSLQEASEQAPAMRDVTLQDRDAQHRPHCPPAVSPALPRFISCADRFRPSTARAALPPSDSLAASFRASTDPPPTARPAQQQQQQQQQQPVPQVQQAQAVPPAGRGGEACGLSTSTGSSLSARAGAALPAPLGLGLGLGARSASVDPSPTYSGAGGDDAHPMLDYDRAKAFLRGSVTPLSASMPIPGAPADQGPTGAWAAQSMALPPEAAAHSSSSHAAGGATRAAEMLLGAGGGGTAASGAAGDEQDEATEEDLMEIRANLLQALRWRIARTESASQRRATLRDFARHDVLGLHDAPVAGQNQSVLACLLSHSLNPLAVTAGGPPGGAEDDLAAARRHLGALSGPGRLRLAAIHLQALRFLDLWMDEQPGYLLAPTCVGTVFAFVQRVAALARPEGDGEGEGEGPEGAADPLDPAEASASVGLIEVSLSVLRKMSQRRAGSGELVRLGAVGWLFALLRAPLERTAQGPSQPDAVMGVSALGLQYGALLLLHLTLRRAGAAACEELPPDGLWGPLQAAAVHPIAQVRIYGLSILFSVLHRRRLHEAALGRGLLEWLTDHGPAEGVPTESAFLPTLRQRQYIEELLLQANPPEELPSDGEAEEEDAEGEPESPVISPTSPSSGPATPHTPPAAIVAGLAGPPSSSVAVAPAPDQQPPQPTPRSASVLSLTLRRREPFFAAVQVASSAEGGVAPAPGATWAARTSRLRGEDLLESFAVQGEAQPAPTGLQQPPPPTAPSAAPAACTMDPARPPSRTASVDRTVAGLSRPATASTTTSASASASASTLPAYHPDQSRPATARTATPATDPSPAPRPYTAASTRAPAAATPGGPSPRPLLLPREAANGSSPHPAPASQPATPMRPLSQILPARVPQVAEEARPATIKSPGGDGGGAGGGRAAAHQPRPATARPAAEAPGPQADAPASANRPATARPATAAEAPAPASARPATSSAPSQVPRPGTASSTRSGDRTAAPQEAPVRSSRSAQAGRPQTAHSAVAPQAGRASPPAPAAPGSPPPVDEAEPEVGHPHRHRPASIGRPPSAGAATEEPPRTGTGSEGSGGSRVSTTRHSQRRPLAEAARPATSAARVDGPAAAAAEEEEEEVEEEDDDEEEEIRLPPLPVMRPPSRTLPLVAPPEAPALVPVGHGPSPRLGTAPRTAPAPGAEPEGRPPSRHALDGDEPAARPPTSASASRPSTRHGHDVQTAAPEPLDGRRPATASSATKRPPSQQQQQPTAAEPGWAATAPLPPPRPASSGRPGIGEAEQVGAARPASGSRTAEAPAAAARPASRAASASAGRPALPPRAPSASGPASSEGPIPTHTPAPAPARASSDSPPPRDRDSVSPVPLPSTGAVPPLGRAGSAGSLARASQSLPPQDAPLAALARASASRPPSRAPSLRRSGSGAALAASQTSLATQQPTASPTEGGPAAGDGLFPRRGSASRLGARAASPAPQADAAPRPTN
ncbi:hypothetical protein PAPYR_5082 [Paratrimastix pyriformis]|uniref:ARMC9 CTLH-like domain-containing protein n=1 Tax=Paratrimastix pyriformis TaxID=342808 RepID=A0ABQ8UM25_9EUKA|nr:hypothetical protein PAPYR_5082 [Paratrimastix pyriformis]